MDLKHRNPLFATIVCILSVAATAYAGSAGVKDWYQDSYGELWKENPWDKVDAIAAHYAETIHSHPSDGPIQTVNSREWLAESLEEWQADGWLGSEITAMRQDRVNPSTVIIKSKWRDWYKEAADEYSCGWYLLDATDDAWVISQYAEIDCAEHKL